MFYYNEMPLFPCLYWNQGVVLTYSIFDYDKKPKVYYWKDELDSATGDIPESISMPFEMTDWDEKISNVLINAFMCAATALF